LLICKGDNPQAGILRKIHFDYEPVENRQSYEIKPSVHLQICGKLNQHLTNAGFKQEHLEPHGPAFEKPRVPCFPVSIALLVHWLMLEFSGFPEARRIINNRHWQAKVKMAEALLLKPFFYSSSEFFKSTSTSLFLNSWVYGLPVS
jgi:hypothetical protein